jgi:hypothetical protein
VASRPRRPNHGKSADFVAPTGPSSGIALSIAAIARSSYSQSGRSRTSSRTPPTALVLFVAALCAVGVALACAYLLQ